MAITKTRLTPKHIAKAIAGFAHEKKADRIVILDLRKSANFCDYFVICSGTSDRRNRAIADSIEDGLDKMGLSVFSKQGARQASWLVMDCGDVIAHIFSEDVREFYSLERLWQDATQVNWKA